MQALEIATVEDLVRVLDEHPQWLEALRSRLLTRELLELPQRLAEFAADTDRRFAEIEGRLAEHDRRFDQIEGRLAEHDRRFDSLDRQIAQIRTDIGPLKAAHARNAVMDEAHLLAEDQGLSLAGILDRRELHALVQRADTGGISRRELRSFQAADVVLRAVDAAGTECYVAVEVSYTANGRDTDRARRNAGFLTRFTGQRAIAVVAGLRIDDRIRPAVDSGEVGWFELAPELLEVD